jgi:glycosyltransferase involved in cell wall biosynthesis
VRIGIIAAIAWRTPPEHYGGWELVASNLTEGLVRQGHEVTLFATADSQTSARLEAVCPCPLNYDKSLDSRVYEALHVAHAFEVARADNFEVLHNNAGCFAVPYTRLINAPTVTTLHGSAAEAGSRQIYQAYCEQAYVSISQAERELAPDLNYVATVYNGIDVNNFAFSDKPGDYLLVVGRMSPDKGIHLAIKVAKQAGIRLVLAGIVPPENEAYFEQEVKPHLEKGRIEFIGPVSGPSKKAVYAGALALLHLVTYREAFGLAMVEAMASGTPVIGVGLGSVSELVRPGLSGVVVPPAEEDQIVAATVKALTQIEKLERSTIRQYALDTFGLERMVAGYLKVYQALRN